jgi:WD40 repeat protein
VTLRRVPTALAALVASLALVSQPAGAGGATPRRQLWDDRLETASNAEALVVSPSGTQLFVTGGGAIFPGGLTTTAYEASTGTRQWSVTSQGNDVAADIGVSPDGGSVFVTGQSGISNSDFLTIAYDAATGAEVWEARYDNKHLDYPKRLVVSPDGSKVFVLGAVYGARREDFALVSYDATTGDELWSWTFSTKGEREDISTSLGVSPDGSMVFVAGFSPGADDVHDFLTVALDASAGQPTWLARYHDPALQEAQAFSLAVSPSGGQVFVTGCASNTYAIGSCLGAPDYLTVAYDSATGTRQWAVTYDGPVQGDDVARSVGVRPDGGLVYVTGYSDQLATTDYVTIAYDASTGTQVWFDAYDGPTYRAEASCCLAVSGDGSRVVITGSSTGFGTTTWSTVGYVAATGRRLWTASYRGFKNYNYPADVAITEDGAIAFVAGQITDAIPGSYEWAVVAYQS